MSHYLFQNISLTAEQEMGLNLAKDFFKILVTDTSEEKELKQSIFEIVSVLKEGVVEQLVVYNKKMTSKYLKDLQTTSAKFILISEEELRAKSYIEIYNALWSIGNSLVELFNKEKVKELGEGMLKSSIEYAIDKTTEKRKC